MGWALTVADFGPELLPAVENFDCGEEPWALAASRWIGAPLEFPGALKSMRDHGTRVWLFYFGQSFVIGFASLGPNVWKLPDGGSHSIGYIPQFAVCVDFHGQPRDVPIEERFAGQIIGHVLAVARDDGVKIVGLRVDSENGRAIRFYEKVGFMKIGGIEERHGRDFVRMIVTI